MRGHRSHGILAVGAALVVGLLGTACATPGDVEPGSESTEAAPTEPIPPSFEPIVFPNPGAEAREGLVRGRIRDPRPVSEEDRGWEEKLRLAAGYADGGFDAAALEVIRAALRQEPPPAWAERFRNLRATLRARRVETDLVRVDARGLRDYLPFGTHVDWRIRIRNVSPGELVFPAPSAGTGEQSPSALSLVVQRRDIDIYGAELRRSWNQTVYLQRAGGPDVRVPAGGIHEVSARVDASDVGPPISGLRILGLTGKLRAVVEDAEGEPHTLVLALRPARVVVLPAGYEPLARDPLGSIETAIETVAPGHLLVATEFVPRGRSLEAVAHLAGALADGDPALRTAALGGLGLLGARNAGRPAAPFAAPLMERLQRRPERAEPLMEGLARVSGRSLPPDPRLWLDWWRRAARDGAVIPAPDPGTGPLGGRE